MNILFLGAPGCGKGTQSKMIIKEFDIPQISTGDLLRGEISSGSEMGNELKQIMSGFVEQMGQVVNRPITVELNGNKVGQALGQDSYRIQ